MPDSTRAVYNRTVKALRQLMAVPKDEREQHYRTAAEKIVELRQQHPGVDGIPDWGGTRSREYRALIQQAYREAGVPSDSEDTVQASIRYHVGNRVREVAPKADLDALDLAREGPRARLARETPRRSRKAAAPPTDLPMPSVLADALEDPVGLVRHAIRALEAAQSLKPRGPDGETIRYMLGTLRDAVDDLARMVSETDL